MKKIKKIKIARNLFIGAIFTMTGFSTVAQGNTTTANIGAKIVSAISNTKVVDLNFGKMTTPTGAEIVTISTQGVVSGSLGNTQLFSTGATNAIFDLNGQAYATYVITLPGDGAVTIYNSKEGQMKVNNFIVKPASMPDNMLTGKLDAGGKDVIIVGASLYLNKGQSSGTYTGSFAVTVNYN
jgi:hypothetical protein